MSARRGPGTRRGERGFVLVGVVMFILALTIIGLTLFDLSGYEAQFFERSVDEEQAYQVAMGGLAWAQWALAVQNDMRVVRTTPLPPGITYVRARYAATQDSLAAPINWNPANLIEIRVQAQHHMARRLLEATYRPQPPRDYWKRLMSMSGGLNVEPSHPAFGGNTGLHTMLQGAVWQNADTTQWWPLLPASIRAAMPHPIRQVTPVPALDVAAYFTQHWAAATPVAYQNSVPPSASTKPAAVYTLDPGNPNAIAWFRTAWDPGSGTPFSVENRGDEIHVRRGVAVWMLDRGLYMDARLKVTGGTKAALVLVAREGPGTGGRGVWLNGGIDTDGTPVYVASDADVQIHHYNNYTKGASPQPGLGVTPYIAIVARNVSVLAPIDYDMQLGHPLDASQDQAGGLVEDLYDAGALPLPGGVQMRGTLKLLAGSWREVKESDPD